MKTTTTTDHDLMSAAIAARLRQDFLQLMAQPARLLDVDAHRDAQPQPQPLPGQTDQTAVGTTIGAQLTPEPSPQPIAPPRPRQTGRRPIVRQLPAIDPADAF